MLLITRVSAGFNFFTSLRYPGRAKFLPDLPFFILVTYRYTNVPVNLLHIAFSFRISDEENPDFTWFLISNFIIFATAKFGNDKIPYTKASEKVGDEDEHTKTGTWQP